METKKYVYGIVLDVSERIDNIQTEDGVLSFIPYKNISAVVSDTNITVNLENTDKHVVARQLIKHQKMIERIMGMGYTVIPMKLATYMENEKMVKELLRSAYGILTNLESEVNNKIEVDIVAVWANFGEVLGNIAENNTIKEAKEKLANKQEGVTREDQQQLGILISKLIKLRNKEISQKSYTYLKGKYLEIKEHDVMNDEMVFNTSFLIQKKDIEKFNKAVDALDKFLEERVNFRYVGPLPCYSFYSLEAVNIDFAQLLEARDILGMTEDTAGLSDIKKCYREKAVINHPDKMKEIKSNDEFNKINKAYKCLIDFFNARKVAEPEFKKIIFTREAFDEKSILVKLKD